jgi:hypothetical protein
MAGEETPIGKGLVTTHVTPRMGIWWNQTIQGREKGGAHCVGWWVLGKGHKYLATLPFFGP